MNALEQIAEEKTKLQDRIARDQKRLSDLEAAERVLPSLEGIPVRARTAHVTKDTAEAVNAGVTSTVTGPTGWAGTPDPTPRRRGRPPGTGQRTGNGVKAEKSGTTIGDRVLEIVTRTAMTQRELNEALKPARPNHIGIALRRHLKANRIFEREGAFFPA